MSTNENNSRPSREPARRVFAEEYNQASFQFKEGSSDQSPKFVLLPSGEKANRVMFIGTLTDKEQLNGDNNWRGQVSDPTGTFYVYAGQYQPEAAAALSQLEAPEYVAVIGKPETFTNDDGETYVSVRAEQVVAIDESSRHNWVADAAERTMDRYQTLTDTESFEDSNYDPYERYGEEVVNAVPETVVTALEHLSDDLGETDEE
jgi:RPA family protein